MKKLRIDIVGLGGIAQKVWLPVLGTSADWALQGTFSPSRDKAQRICDTWRIPYMGSSKNLTQACDAVFIHSSTATHYAVVSKLPNAEVRMCMDEPLAENLRKAEQLVELVARKRLTLMVGFNRRFAPLYQGPKTQLSTVVSMRMDKHHMSSVGPHDLYFTLLDGYLHVINTTLWLAGGRVQLNNGTLLANGSGVVLYIEHHFSVDQVQITTSMHRCADSQRESVQAVTNGSLIDATNMWEWREERGQGVVHKPITGWQTTLEQRSFAGCMRHLIECVQNQTVSQMAGEQALPAQRAVEKLWWEAIAE